MCFFIGETVVHQALLYRYLNFFMFCNLLLFILSVVKDSKMFAYAFKYVYLLWIKGIFGLKEAKDFTSFFFLKY